MGIADTRYWTRGYVTVQTRTHYTGGFGDSADMAEIKIKTNILQKKLVLFLLVACREQALRGGTECRSLMVQREQQVTMVVIRKALAQLNLMTIKWLKQFKGWLNGSNYDTDWLRDLVVVLGSDSNPE